MAHAVTCSVQILSVSAPHTIIAGQGLEIDTYLRITCTSTTDNIVARVDLSNEGSAQVLSSNSLALGSVDGLSKTWNVTIPNTAQAPSTGTWKLATRAWVFAGTELVAKSSKSIEIEVVQPATTTSSLVSSITSSTVTYVHPPEILSNTIAIGLIVIGAAVAAIVVKKRTEKHPRTEGELITQELERPSSTISTGYKELDASLEGGLPAGYAIIIVSPPYDERDLLLAKMIGTCLSMGFSVFFMSRDMSRTSDLASRYKQNFYAFNPQADKIAGQTANIFKIQSVQNLNDVNISLSKAMAPMINENPKKILIIDFLSDILLEHKALTTRKWLDDFIAKRKVEGFTILAALNPLIVSDQERQTIIDLFEGVIEINEKSLPERPKRYAIVKKMYGRKYKDTGIDLEKDRLF